MAEDQFISIERLSFGGDGIGKIEGKVVFVPFSVPGDRLKVRIVESKERFNRGEILEIIEPSPLRVQPPCPVFGRCGGCQWQQIDYPSQLSSKELILRETLERIGGLKGISILPIISSAHPWNYRNRLQLHRDSKGRIGFLAREAHEVVEFEECFIADPKLNEAVQRLRREAPTEHRLFELAMTHDSKVTLSGLKSEDDRAFSQTNPSVNEELVKTVFQFAFGGAEAAFTQKWNIVELYCGKGNLTFALAQAGGRVIAVDESREALKEAEEEAKKRRMTHLEFIASAAEWGLKTVLRRGMPVDILVLDPPRRGAKEILDLLLVIKPRVIVYVSCDPSTLARDLKFLVNRHYEVEMVRPLDMFPQTYHIESVTKLVRKNGN
ncbi:MAG: class I SAM-dependent RNA methyltransferase [Deltaproteobacteria bacterium]|nr:class I SAM-dependent RNA methyltransferase [Deltaproteobacteria bacterium]